MQQKLKGGLFSLSRFSSLGQMVQFETMQFWITFEELFWSVRVD